MSPQADILRRITSGPFSRRRRARTLCPPPPADLLSRVAGIESAGDSADSKSGDDSIFLRPKHRTRDKNLYGESGHKNRIGYPSYIERGEECPVISTPTIGTIL